VLRNTKANNIFKVLGYCTAGVFAVFFMSISASIAGSGDLWLLVSGVVLIAFVVFDVIAGLLWLLLWFVRKYA
jgi:hypothetical protein